MARSVDLIYELSNAKIIASKVKDNLPFLKKDGQILLTLEEKIISMSEKKLST